ncbi:hypothetical protein JW935_23630, partial [candidate division KSB1 bacterium]|nr:hypothetical protein [candidate division KSB1 bacterium]
MMAPVFSQGQLAIIDITSRNLVGDANIENKPDDGPEVFTVGGDFRNNGIDTLKHVYVTIGDGTNAGIFPETIVPPGGDYEGTFSLRLLDNDTEDAERYLGHLLPGEQKSVYWEIVYPLLDAAGHAVWGDPNDSDDDLKLKFTIWGNCIEASSQSPQSVSLNDSVYVRNEQKAATSKIQPTPDGYYTIVAGPNLSPGQTVTVTYNNVSFGNVNQGFDVDGYPGPDYDLWYQPIGELDWDPNVFRLVRTSATIHGSQCGAGRPDVDIFLSDSTYISKLDQYGSCGWEGSYEYTFAAIGLGSCTLTPYQEVASGSDNEKYNSDYGGDDLAGCDYCVTLTSQEGGLEFSKNVDKMYALDGDTLTYTIILFNNSSLPVGDPDLSIFPIVTDSIPLLGFYLSSSIQTFLDCITLYSVDNGQTWLTEEPAPGTGITHLRWTINQQFLPGQIDSIQFKFIINQDLSDTIVNYADLSFMGEIPVQIDSAVTFVNQLGHITGQVWIDENQNGIRETVENATPP